jgi:hypothetical protein
MATISNNLERMIPRSTAIITFCRLRAPATSARWRSRSVGCHIHEPPTTACPVWLRSGWARQPAPSDLGIIAAAALEAAPARRSGTTRWPPRGLAMLRCNGEYRVCGSRLSMKVPSERR